MACGEAVHVPSSVEGKSSPMVRTAGIARSIMDCLLKNNGYWIVPVPAVLVRESQVKPRRGYDLTQGYGIPGSGD